MRTPSLFNLAVAGCSLPAGVDLIFRRKNKPYVSIGINPEGVCVIAASEAIDVCPTFA